MSTERGIRVHTAIWYPAHNDTTNVKGDSGNHSTSVMDLVPTMLELAGVQHPGSDAIYKPDGRSLALVLSDEKDFVRSNNDVIEVELAGRQARHH